MAVSALLALACGVAEPEPAAVTATVPATATTPGGGPATTETGLVEGPVVVPDGAPEPLVVPQLVAFERGLIAWGLTSSGDGAVAVIDADTGGWYEVVHRGGAPYCGAAVSFDGGVVLIGNESVQSERVIGLTVDIATRTGEPLEVPAMLTGRCPGAVATPNGLLAWTTDPEADPPVTVAILDAASGTWNELPAPPFLAGTYDTGGIYHDDQLILIASTEGVPRFVGASLGLTDLTWSPLPDAPVVTWEGPRLIWTGSDVMITSSWPETFTGGEVDPFPEPLAPGGTYDPDSRTWKPSALAPPWTDGIPIWTGAQVVWWLPGSEHATVYDPGSDRWWHISVPSLELPPEDHDTLWAGAWTGTHAVATDGSGFYSWVPDLTDVIELDPSGQPRTDQPLAPGAAVGTRSGRLGLVGQACGFRGRNTVSVTIAGDDAFSLDYVIDLEEPCGTVVVHEGSVAGTIDAASRRFNGSGRGTVDGRPVVVACECEITADNQVVGELTIDGLPQFIVALADV